MNRKIKYIFDLVPFLFPALCFPRSALISPIVPYPCPDISLHTTHHICGTGGTVSGAKLLRGEEYGSTSLVSS